MIKRILIGIGGTPFTSVAIQRAVEVGGTHGAHVTAVTIVDENRLRKVGPVPLGGGAAASGLRAHRLRVTREKIADALDDLEKQCAAKNVPLTMVHEHGDPFRVFTQHARYHDLMVLGVRSMFEYDLLGSDDVEPATVLNDLAKAGVSPILAVSERLRAIRRVLFAYDGSVRAAQSLKQFLQLRPWPDAKLRVLACDDPVEDARQSSEDARDYCLCHGVDTDATYRPGDAAEQILAEVSSWDADLLILGCSGRSSLSRSLFGATALDVLRRVDRPLFLGG